MASYEGSVRISYGSEVSRGTIEASLRDRRLSGAAGAATAHHGPIGGRLHDARPVKRERSYFVLDKFAPHSYFPAIIGDKMASMSRTKPAWGDPRPVAISIVERETGLSKDTLRVWERRYGFPVPSRDHRGERRYPPEQVQKLRIISRLVDGGQRPGKLVNVPLVDLAERFKVCRSAPEPGAHRAPEGTHEPLMQETLGLLERYDGAAVRAHLSRALLRLGLHRFVIEVLADLNERVGDAWLRGDITVSQEHLYTEQVQFLLRHEIGSIDPGARAPSVMLTTLPSEEHQLGILMAHACFAVEGVRCISFGAQTPLWDIAQAACRQEIDAIGLSFSEAFKLNVACAMLEDLRGRVPARIDIWAGGKLWARTHRRVPGVRFITVLTQIPQALAAHRRQHAHPELNT